MLKKIKAKHIVVIAVLIVIFALLSNGGSAEKSARKFVENMLDGRARECVSLLTDDAVEQTGYTRKVLISVMDGALEQMREDYKSKYGKRWKYKITVIDSYEFEAEYYAGERIGNAVTVVVGIQHTGSATEDEETETLVLIKDGRKWLVAGFGF